MVMPVCLFGCDYLYARRFWFVKEGVISFQVVESLSDSTRAKAGSEKEMTLTNQNAVPIPRSTKLCDHRPPPFSLGGPLTTGVPSKDQ